MDAERRDTASESSVAEVVRAVQPAPVAEARARTARIGSVFFAFVTEATRFGAVVSSEARFAQVDGITNIDCARLFGRDRGATPFDDADIVAAAGGAGTCV